MTQRRLHQCITGWLAVFTLQLFFQRTGINTNTNRNAVIPGRLDYGPDTIFAANVTRIDAQTINPQLGYTQGDLVVIVDVRHQRHINQLADLAKSLGGIHRRHRHTHNIGTDIF